MVLADLGKRLNSAIASLSSTSPIDEASLDLALRSISSALLSSDINVHLVQSLLQRIKAGALPQLVELNKKGEKGVDVTAGNRGKGIIQKVVVDELVRLVDGGGNKGVHEMKKGTTSVIMLVGLQGAGKTTTCTKLATHYTRRGFKTALVCADTFRAGAFDQLKQNAVKARVPFFGSYTETDPAAIAAAGVTKFRAERFDIIIVDTSGRHKQEAELFDEMVLIKEAVRPDLTVLVMDGGIGQAAEAQSKAFKEAAGFGAIIVTKLDGHAKGGGAISAVAATNTPIIFLGTGEHLHDLETFTPGPFISKMLGMGDMQGLVERAREMEEANPGRREGMMEKMATGVFSVRDLKEQMETIAGLGPLSNLTSMIPGMSDMMAGNEDEAGKKMRRMAFIFDAMSTFELDSDGSCFRGPVPSSSSLVATPSKGKETVKVANANGKDKASEVQEGPREPNARVLRVARGSGTSVNEVEEILAQHQMFAGMVKKAGGKGGWMSKMKAQQSAMARRGGPGGAGGMPGMPDMANLSPGQLAQMQNMLPPGMREQMAQPGAMAQMAEMMKGMGGRGGLGGMMGGGGMPDMAKMMAGMGMGK